MASSYCAEESKRSALKRVIGMVVSTESRLTEEKDKAIALGVLVEMLKAQTDVVDAEMDRLVRETNI